jgi:hypothetical protein
VFLFVCARSQYYRNGKFEQNAKVFESDGNLLGNSCWVTAYKTCMYRRKTISGLLIWMKGFLEITDGMNPLAVMD